MAFKLRRPVLVGGLGLTAGAWLLQWGHPHSGHAGELLTWGALAVGSGVWWLKQQAQLKLSLPQPLQPVDRTTVETALATIAPLLNQLETEQNLTTDSVSLLPSFRDRLASLTSNLDRTSLQLTIIGGKSTGKTALAQQLTTHWLPQQPRSLNLCDSPSLLVDAAADAALLETTALADLVLFVTSGDLTDSEFQVIQQLVGRHQRLLLVLNKQDQHLPEERSLLLQQLRDRLQGKVPAADVVAIAAVPSPIKVRRHQADGTIQEAIEQPASEVTALQQRLTALLNESAPQLVLATTLRQVNALRVDIQGELNRLRRDRALPLIEQAQWLAAGAAFATPVASLDLLATAAINTQLVIDVGALYKQSFSLEQARAIAGTLAELMVKLGLVELSSQAIAPLLKGHALTFVAGGLVQGLSAAYLTRVAGLSLVAYFQEQSLVAPTGSFALQRERIASVLKTVFQDNQRSAFLQTLVQQGVSRLTSKPQPVEAAS